MKHNRRQEKGSSTRLLFEYCSNKNALSPLEKHQDSLYSLKYLDRWLHQPQLLHLYIQVFILSTSQYFWKINFFCSVSSIWSCKPNYRYYYTGLSTQNTLHVKENAGYLQKIRLLLEVVVRGSTSRKWPQTHYGKVVGISSQHSHNDWPRNGYEKGDRP